MNSENLLVTVLVGILTHAGATIWWASRVHTTLEYIAKELSQIQDSYSDFQGKHEDTISLLYTRIDNLRDKVIKLESERK